MKQEKKAISTKEFEIKEGEPVRLGKTPTQCEVKELDKKEAEEALAVSRKHLQEMQDKLYADSRYSVLIVLQAMDAGGKDGAVKHIMSGFNPLGVKVYSFKAPTLQELDHDYFWRHEQALPARGEIAIHNRSHYENVLVTRVHPELILKENIPGISSVKDIDKAFWKKRFKQIRRFEKNLAENGTVILKFFLHISKKEQKRRFLERIEDPTKNWKFSVDDLKERGYWNEYQQYYEEAIAETSTAYAPWFIVPSDDKWFARMTIADVIHKHFSKLKLAYPTVNPEQKKELQKAKAALLKKDKE